MNSEQLQKKREELEQKVGKIQKDKKIVLSNMGKIVVESERVSKLAGNARSEIQKLDEEFAEMTKFNRVDVAFLFLATALQCVRIYVINSITKTQKAGKGTVEKKLKKGQKKILDNLDNGQILSADKYYAPLNQIITIPGVPYDVQHGGKDLDIFKGANHRFSTYGHDPILGLIFGTSNILTNTITTKQPIPFMSHHVEYDGNFKNPIITTPANTFTMIQSISKRFEDDKASLVAALIKQVIHIGTDMFTPCGIQLPFTMLVLSNKNVEKLTKYISYGDVVKIGASADIAMLIDALISTLHMLMYNEDDGKYPSPDVYSVKTKEIIMCSNLIATSSNFIANSVRVACGDATAIKNYDIGGALVAIPKLINDTQFIYEVKKEFVYGGFAKKIQGGDLNLQPI